MEGKKLSEEEKERMQQMIEQGSTAGIEVTQSSAVVQSNDARLSLIFGLLAVGSVLTISFFGSAYWLPMIAIAFGVKGLHAISRKGKALQFKGRGLAITGILLAVFSYMLSIFLVVLTFKAAKTPTLNEAWKMQIASETWQEFNSSEGAFSILLPGTPTEETNTVDTAAGPIDIISLSVQQNDVMYLVIYSEFPNSVFKGRTPDEILDGACDGAVSDVQQGKLLGELAISLNGYPGRELEIEALGGMNTVKTRIFAVDNRLYQVILVAPKAMVFLKMVKVSRFLDSFKLLEK